MRKEEFDEQFLRCPLLGGEVPFSYCRRVNDGGPCRRMPFCWGDRIDIAGYIEGFYSQDEIQRFFLQDGPGRLGRIMENLRRVKDMKDTGEKRDELIAAIKADAQEGRISCAQAWALADRFAYSKLELGKLLNELKIKLTHCQLGCF